MTVVMEKNGIVCLGNGRDEQVDRGRPAVLTALGEHGLGSRRESADPRIERQAWEMGERRSEVPVVGRTSGGIEKLERHGGTQRKRIALQQKAPPILGLAASMPGARVSEEECHREALAGDGALRATDLCRRRAGSCP